MWQNIIQATYLQSLGQNDRAITKAIEIVLE